MCLHPDRILSMSPLLSPPLHSPSLPPPTPLPLLFLQCHKAYTKCMYLEHHKAWTPGLARGPRNHPEIQRFPFTDEETVAQEAKGTWPRSRSHNGPLGTDSVQFSRSVMSNSLRPHELQHARPPCPSPTPGVHPNPCPSSR